MARIGKYRYPVIDLDRATTYIAKFMDKCKGEATRETFIIEVLGLSPRSSRPIQLISSLVQYGLIDSSRGKISVTERGKIVVYGEEHEKIQALAEAARSIALIKDYYDKYGSDLSIDKIRIFLREVGGADIDEARREAPSIQRILSCGIKYIEREKSMRLKRETSEEPLIPEREMGPSTQAIPSQPYTVQLAEGIDLEIRSRDFGVFYVRDLATLELAKTMFEGIVKILEEKYRRKPEEKSKEE